MRKFIAMILSLFFFCSAALSQEQQPWKPHDRRHIFEQTTCDKSAGSDVWMPGREYLYRKAGTPDSSFTELGRWAWGPCRAVAISGHYALVGQGHMYQVFDISNLSSPRIVYDTVMEEAVKHIEIKDTLLFVLLGNIALICKASSPFPLVEIGRINIYHGLLVNMSVSDSLLYLLDRMAGVLIVNIADPANPYYRTDFCLSDEFNYGIAAKGQIFYYGPAAPGGMVVVQYKPDTAILKWQRTLIGCPGTAIVIRDTLLFEGDAGGSLFIFSISDPWNIQLIDSVSVGSSPVYSIATKDDDVYCALNDSGIAVVNIADLLNPRIVARNYRHGYSQKLANSDTALAMAEYVGFAFFDISSEDSIKNEFSFPTGGQIYSVAARGKVCFLAAGEAGGWTIDVSDPAHIRQITNIPTRDCFFDVALAGNLACFLNVNPSITWHHDSLVVTQFSDGGSLVRLSSIDVGTISPRGIGAISIAARDSLVFVGTDSSVGIFLIADPFHPRRIGTWQSGGRYNLVSVSRNNLAVASSDHNQGISIVDISNPESPRQRSFLPTSTWPDAVLMEDSLLFAIAGDLLIIDVSNPASPVILGKVWAPNGNRIVRSGNFIYYTNGVAYAVDISDLSHPVRVDSFVTPNWSAVGVAVSTDTVYLATRADGFWILKNSLVTSVRNTSFPVPSEFTLSNSHPNPFNPSTIIAYELPEKSFVTLEVFDVLGREVRTLVSEVRQAGTYKAVFDATSLPSGIYFYRLTASHNTITKKMILLR